MPKVSIIIRCFNEEAHIGRLLSGITQQTYKDLQIIIVDSGSTDATLSIASQYPVSILHINKTDFSFGRSLNIGCEAASGDILIFASAHVYPLYADWISQMLEPFKDERVACAYGRQIGNSATKFSEHQVFARWFPELSEPKQDHPFCNNANAAVRRSIWDQVHYDETLTGLEDLAWATRVVSAGHLIAYNAKAEVVHVHEETALQVLNRYRREAIAMKAIFPHEKFSFQNFVSTFTKNVVNDARLAIKLGVFWENSASILSFRLMQFWGTYRGYAQQGVVSKKLREKFYYPPQLSIDFKSKCSVNKDRQTIDYSGHEKEFPGE